MGNSCNSKKLGGKNLDFPPIFWKTVANFGVPSAPVYGHWGLYGMAEKNSGISLILFRQRAPNVFIGVFLKVHERFFGDRRGRNLRLSVEGRQPHSCITFLSSHV